MSNQNSLYIIGAGGFAKEVYFLWRDLHQAGRTPYRFEAFVDREAREPVAIGGASLPVIVEDELFASLGKSRSAGLAIGIGDPGVSSRIIRRIRERPGSERLEFPNLIHPTFVGLMDDIRFGEGNIVTAGCIFTVGIKVGSFNIFNLSTTVGHDAEIGSFNVFNPGCNISGSVRIGDRNLFGTNATMLQGLGAGSDLIVGAGGVVTKDLESGYVYVGAPAKPIKENRKP